MERSNYLFPWQCARQLFQPVGAGCVDLFMQRVWQDPPSELVLEESTEGGDHMLQTETVVGLRGLAKKCLDSIQIQSSDYRGVFIVFEEVLK